MKINMLFWNKVLGYKVSVFFVLIPIVLWFIALRKQPEKKPENSLHLAKRLFLDSLKIQKIEYEKDSIIAADSVYIRELSTMSRSEIEKEFHNQFSK